MVSVYLLPFVQTTNTSLDPKPLCPPRSHRLCPLSRDGLARCCRLLHLGTPAFASREGHRRHQQGMWLAQPLVLRYVSTLATCPCPLIDATTSSTSLARHVQPISRACCVLMATVRSGHTMAGTVSSSRACECCVCTSTLPCSQCYAVLITSGWVGRGLARYLVSPTRSKSTVNT